ncbi:MAG: hypothetical protein RR791_02425 [Lachnospiraceae bacterium]
MKYNVCGKLFELQDIGYRDFHAKLIPTINPDTIIGVRTPVLRKFAKEFGKHPQSQEYYVNMMIAWYFATALAKQYVPTLPYIEQNCLEPFTHNKTIQKAVESYRITTEQKIYLRTLKTGGHKKK